MINKKQSQPYLGKFRQGYVIKWGFWLVKFLDSVKIRKKKKKGGKCDTFFFFQTNSPKIMVKLMLPVFKFAFSKLSGRIGQFFSDKASLGGKWK